MISSPVSLITREAASTSMSRDIAQSDEPLVSIIMVVFGAASDLLGVIESVASLKNENIEFIVIDGGSTDGTCELLSQHNHVIDYWVSESDRGIYDAMNKGIAAARGTFILHLNAGDRLVHIPTEELIAAKENCSDVLACRVLIDGEHVFRPRFGIALRVRNTLHHQGTFYRRACFPIYNIDYRVFADFDANQRLVRGGAHITISDQIVASHMSGGLSDIQTKATVAEFFRVISRNYGWTHLLPAWLVCKWHGLSTRLLLLRRRLSR